jgi:stage IV sporulation protein FB
MFETGYLTVARWKGTPIRFHWSIPLGMLLFGRFAFVPGLWAGYLLIVLLHEMGHAWLSRRMGLRAISIEVHGLGGQCRYGGASVSPWQRSVVAWGGVLAQAMLLVIALAVAMLAPLPPIAFVDQLLGALISTNVMIMVLNLLPFPPLDGAEAWRIIPLYRAQRARARARKAHREVEVRVRSSAHLELGEVDEHAVRETVRRALSEAKRDASTRKSTKS